MCKAIFAQVQENRLTALFVGDAVALNVQYLRRIVHSGYVDGGIHTFAGGTVAVREGELDLTVARSGVVRVRVLVGHVPEQHTYR